MTTLDDLISAARPPQEITRLLIASHEAEQERLANKEEFLRQQSNYFQHRGEIWACADKSRAIEREIERLREKLEDGLPHYGRD
jgi:protein-arginine kinase activator protein McsA